MGFGGATGGDEVQVIGGHFGLQGGGGTTRGEWASDGLLGQQPAISHRAAGQSRGRGESIAVRVLRIWLPLRV